MPDSQLLRRFLVELSRPSKQMAMVAIDIPAYAVCALATGWLLSADMSVFGEIYPVAVIAILIAVPLGWLLGLYETVVRYIGTEFLIRASLTAAISAAAVSAISYAAGFGAAPFRWAVIFWALSLLYICSSRLSSRMFLAAPRPGDELERVLIYGAGSAGAQLAGYLRFSRTVLPVAMVDDDLSLEGKRVKGLKVHSSSELESVIRKAKVNKVLLALPRVSRRRRRIILERIEDLSVHVQTIPDFDDLVSGEARVDDIRDVSLSDLMGREAVPPDAELLRANIEPKNVMVTGAGGSIGSELCRQIVMLKVSRLILFDNCEPSLYTIDRELRGLLEQHSLECEIVPLLGSICDYERVSEAIKAYNVHTIYHAAAYKHVPIVEQNLLEGIKNNALGTLQLATAACEGGVDTFVLVSTDKAVHPTSVMGATKRIAELTLQAIQEHYPETRTCIVRFGNVLDSSGSVVPLFREQIRLGGPITVTHRDIVRYFMTIPEAAELVIQAGAMARGGDVFLLDMGEPIRIQDLAKRMVRLMGLTICDEDNPDGDIEIEYIGLRPAEKLYEELLVGDDVSGTEHPRIMRAVESFEPFTVLISQMEELSAVVSEQDCEKARRLIFDIVSTYQPTVEISDLVWTEKIAASDVPDESNITELAPGISKTTR